MRILFSIFAFVILSTPAMAALDTAPEGYWVTENEQAVVKIEKCAEKLCGTLHWIKDNSRVYDDKNEDPALQNRPLCGLQILSDFTQNPQNGKLWDDGTVYKSDEGETYSGYIRVNSNDELYLRGYVGISIFGKSQIWNRVAADAYPACTKP